VGEDALFLTAPNAVETGFRFQSGLGETLGIPVAGTYRVSLVVCDDNEPSPMCSSNTAEVVFNAVPQESFHVELTWDSPSYDYDLHVIRAGGPYCTQNSCFYANCNVNDATIDPPEWDGVAGNTSGDPTLDIDDLSGYGPENINIDTPD
jgi:hypothetical protein